MLDATLHVWKVLGPASYALSLLIILVGYLNYKGKRLFCDPKIENFLRWRGAGPPHPPGDLTLEFSEAGG